MYSAGVTTASPLLVAATLETPGLLESVLITTVQWPETNPMSRAETGKNVDRGFVE